MNEHSIQKTFKNYDLLYNIFQYNNVGFSFQALSLNQHLQQQKLNLLNYSENVNLYYDVGIFSLSTQDQIYNIDGEDNQSIEQKIEFNFKCPLSSQSNDQFIKRKYDQFKLKQSQINQIQYNFTFDYKCQIVSDEAGFYLELLNCGENTIQCFQRRFHKSNIYRTTLFGILCALQYIEPGCLIKFILKNQYTAYFLKYFNNISTFENVMQNNIDLLEKIVQYNQIKFCFKVKINFEQRFTDRLELNKENKSLKYYDCGFSDNLTIDQNQNEQLVSSNQITSENNSITIFKRSDVKLNKPNFDFICQIVSNKTRFYLEIKKQNDNTIQCYHGQYDTSTETRITLYGIIQSLQYVTQIKQQYCILFILQYPNAGEQILSYQSNKQFLINSDLLQKIFEFHDIQFYFQRKCKFESIIMQQLNISLSSHYSDHSSHTDVQDQSSQNISYQESSSTQNESNQQEHSTKSLSNNSNQEPQNISEHHSNLKINQNKSSFLLSGSNSFENEIEPQVTKIFEFQNLTTEQQKTVRKVLMEMDVSFQLLKSAQNQ
ncbi:Hypothetical_protein [Hexamita inflata]|uniref:Hypothetical_protein n=1 Tax=Hexamita inflata TaxID=28002 RepID=A0AA86RE37_9EUKA|nr:Hypothetical protein HINF_LOCUS62367 [Hexamita inflata]